MNKGMLGLSLGFCTLLMACSVGNGQGQVFGVEQDSANIKNINFHNIPSEVISLLTAYPCFIVRYTDGYLLLSDSSKILYDD